MGLVLASRPATADRSVVHRRSLTRTGSPQAAARTLDGSVTEVPTFSVSRSPAAVLQRCGDHPCPPSGCSPKSDDQAHDLHRHADSGSVPSGLARGVELARRVVSRAGDPLPSSVAGSMGRTMGVDLTGTRVHTDALAGESAASLGATAYTVGDHIVFGPGGFAPGTSAGSRLLAHELTHVAQAGGPGSGAPTRAAFAAGKKGLGESAVSSPYDPAEREASRAEGRVAAPATGTSHATIHRQVAGSHGSPAPEESSSQLEGVYRRLGDNRRADAIRMCRVNGGDACGVVLTQREVSALLALSKSAPVKIEAAVKAHVRQGLGAAAPSLASLAPVTVAGRSLAPTFAEFLHSGGMASAAGGTGATATTATATAATATTATTATATTATATTATATATTATATTATTATATGGTVAGIGAGTVAAAAGVTAIVAICVIAGIQLWELGRFQAELEAGGHIILDDALQVCIKGCHMGGPQPLSRLGDRFPAPPLRLDKLPDWVESRGGPRTGTTTTQDVAPHAQPRADTEPQTETRERRRTRPRAYPIFWPTILPPPPQTEFVRTPVPSRDIELAKEVDSYKWFRARPEKLRGESLIGHHVVPLMLGGSDTRDNIILWNVYLHRRGHPCLNEQPQMLTPPAPLPPLPKNLMRHPPGTPYVLAGFKTCTPGKSPTGTAP